VIKRNQLVVVLGVCALAVFFGYSLKAQCLEPWDGRQYSSGCYNDIQALYHARGIADQTFPYIDGDLVDGELVKGAIEYPVLTGVFMWGSGLTVDHENEYLRLSAILLAPAAVVIAFLLFGLTGWRALMWSAAPALVLYSFHNWDLLVVLAAVAGIWAWARDRPGWAAVAFGIGGAFKMYPLFFLAPLILDRSFRRDWRGAAKVLGVGAGTWIAINLPFAAANFDGWWATYEFHRIRLADFNSIWQWWTPQWGADQLNLVTGGLTLGAFAIALGVGWWRARREGAYPVVQVCAAMLAAFLIFNKVHSPQYALWILPFFPLVRVHFLWWVAYAVVDLVVYVSIFRWFYDFGYRHIEVGEWKRWLIVGVWARAGLLLVLFALFLVARSTVRERAARREVSHGVATVEAQA
jgi:uncharacterized membrane protein